MQFQILDTALIMTNHKNLTLLITWDNTPVHPTYIQEFIKMLHLLKNTHISPYGMDQIIDFTIITCPRAIIELTHIPTHSFKRMYTVHELYYKHQWYKMLWYNSQYKVVQPPGLTRHIQVV